MIFDEKLFVTLLLSIVIIGLLVSNILFIPQSLDVLLELEEVILTESEFVVIFEFKTTDRNTILNILKNFDKIQIIDITKNSIKCKIDNYVLNFKTDDPEKLQKILKEYKIQEYEFIQKSVVQVLYHRKIEN